MNSKHLAVPTLLAALTAAAAQSSPPPIPLELRARFGFRGPLITKIGDGIGDLQVADVDGDGRVEAVVFDARRARLCAVGIDDDADSPVMLAIPTGGQIAGYAFGDTDGDGRTDLVLVDSRGRLQVRPGVTGEATRSFDLGLGGRGVMLVARDLDRDGKADLVALASGNLRVVTRLAGEPQMSPIEPLEPNLHSVHLRDVDGDGADDLVCVAPGERMNLRLRRGRGDGTFGPWTILGVDLLRDVFPFPSGRGADLLTIEGNLRRVARHRVEPRHERAAAEWWSFGEVEGTRTPPFVLGDLDGDGDDDLVAFPSERAQMLVYEWRDGTFWRRALPTLAGVASAALGDVDGDGRADLVLASPEEDAVAWCSGAEPLDRFPHQLPAGDKPVAVAVLPGGGVLALCRDDKRNAKLLRVNTNGEPATLADLGRLPADPVRLLVGDFGDRDGLEVAFVVPGEGLRTLSLAGADKPTGKATAGFTRKLEDGCLVQSRRDGRDTLLAVRDRFVRTFRIDAQDQVQVLAQDNGPEGAAELSLACELPDGFCFFDKKNDKVLRTEGDAPPRTREVPGFGFSHMLAHGDAVLMVGPRGLLRLPWSPGVGLREVAAHDPPTEQTFYWHGDCGDFDGDGTLDVVVIDRHLPGVQILAGDHGGLLRALAVPVFEVRPSEQPDNEPSAMATGDLDGDGRCDLVLIAHDRIFVYPQDS